MKLLGKHVSKDTKNDLRKVHNEMIQMSYVVDALPYRPAMMYHLKRMKPKLDKLIGDLEHEKSSL